MATLCFTTLMARGAEKRAGGGGVSIDRMRIYDLVVVLTLENARQLLTVLVMMLHRVHYICNCTSSFNGGIDVREPVCERYLLEMVRFSGIYLGMEHIYTVRGVYTVQQYS